MQGDAHHSRMTVRAWVPAAGFAVVLGMAGQAWLGAAESRAARRAAGEDAGATDTAQFTKKLEQILSQQDELIKKLDQQHAEVMEELRIVKVRASLRRN